MGSQDSKIISSTVQGQGIWFSYLQQCKSSQRSSILPFYKNQIEYLQKLFRHLDKKNTKSLQLSQIQQIPFVISHPLYQRIIYLFEQQLKKIKTKKISLQIFLHLFTVFHIETNILEKFKFLFRIYDRDKDFKLNHNDLVSTFKILFREKIVLHGLLDEQAVKNMASQALVKYGSRGQIKLQQFMDLVPHDQVRQVLTFKFSKQYQ